MQSRAPASRTAAPIAAFGAAALAAAVVSHHLGAKPLWLDEAVSVSVAARPLTRLLSVLPHRDANAGVYYLLLHGWLTLGHGEAWDRGVSALSFVATAALAAWLCTKRLGIWIGIVCAALVVTNRALLFYGQEARPYSLAVLLAVASTAALLDSREWRGRTVVYVAVTVLLVYVDLFAVLFVAAAAGAVAIAAGIRSARTHDLAVCWGWIGALTSPVWLVMMTIERGQIGWLGRPSATYLLVTFTNMTYGLGGIVIVAALCVVAWSTRREMNARAPLRIALGALTIAFLAPPLLLWMFAQAVPSFVDRYVLCSALGAIGIVVIAASTMHPRSRPSVAVAVVLLAALGAGQVAALESAPYKYEDPPAVVRAISTATQPGDAVAFGSGGLRTVVDTYVRSGAAFPLDIALAPGGAAERQPDAYAREVGRAALGARLEFVRRLWMVTDPADRGYPSSGPFASDREAVLAMFRRVSTARMPGMDVTLYERE